jgi:hypothetical protein
MAFITAPHTPFSGVRHAGRVVADVVASVFSAIAASREASSLMYASDKQLRARGLARQDIGKHLVNKYFAD